MSFNLKVGEIIKIPFLSNELYDAKILSINTDMLDSRMECEVCFDELNIITFFSIETISNWKKLNNLEE